MEIRTRELFIKIVRKGVADHDVWMRFSPHVGLAGILQEGQGKIHDVFPIDGCLPAPFCRKSYVLGRYLGE